jgi:FMN phosphatase YigB (HAD superfamily)
MRGIIFFDIDYTLVDTDILRPYLEDGKITGWEGKKLPFEKAVYPEVREILEKLGKKYKLGIFSECKADPSFQTAKLAGGGIINFFSPEFIFIGESKAELIHVVADQLTNPKRKADIIFVDDRLDHLKIAKEAIINAKTIRIRRGKYANVDLDYKPSCTVYNLQELSTILINIL